MTRRQYTNVALLVLIFPITELHSQFSHCSVQFINSWLKEGFNYPYPTQWYVKNLCDIIANILKAYLIFRLARMYQVLRIAAAVYLVMKFIELYLFFYDCNTTSYPLLYSFVGLIIVIIAYPKRKQYKETFNSTLNS